MYFDIRFLEKIWHCFQTKGGPDGGVKVGILLVRWNEGGCLLNEHRFLK